MLNDVTRYHNRGDISWGSCVGRCEMDGDFSGLDDLMTEDWTVVKALADAYGSWITKYGIDGFRIDTAKHVDPYFFGRWLPLIQQTAVAAGKPAFTSFGEIWYTDPAQLSEMMRARQLPSVLDFPFQDMARKYVTDKASGGSLAALFADDDYYTTATTNAYGLTTFLGNHDMGRIGFFLSSAVVGPGAATARARPAGPRPALPDPRRARRVLRRRGRNDGVRRRNRQAGPTGHVRDEGGGLAATGAHRRRTDRHGLVLRRVDRHRSAPACAGERCGRTTLRWPPAP